MNDALTRAGNVMNMPPPEMQADLKRWFINFAIAKYLRIMLSRVLISMYKKFVECQWGQDIWADYSERYRKKTV